ncbi:rhodanese-like domain-containing protein [Halosegnis sp.]|uniref:rhodanese-like domain-containing protein n=1 Tax=Halosegnis sp. TaxID=2864959 RepID=UPI0035D43AC4
MDGEISVSELAALLEEGVDVEIVDIRSPAEYERGHVPGSRNIPFAELPSRVEELNGADRVVTICPHGKASVQAARLIASYEGATGTVESLVAGIEGWQEADEPLASEESTSPDADAPF